MKKITAIALALAMLVCLAACGETNTPQPAPPAEINCFRDLLDNNYTQRAMTFSRGKLKALYVSEDGMSNYMLSAPATAEMQDTYNGLDFFADDYAERLNDIIESAEGLSIENIDDRIPAQEELDAFVGRTFADMEDEGFSERGSFFTDDFVSYSYSNGIYECEFTADPKTGTEDAPQTYVIKEVAFNGLSPDIIEEPFNEEIMLARVRDENSVRAFYENSFGATSFEPDDSDEFMINFDGYEDGEHYAYTAVLGFDEAARAEYSEIRELMDTDFEAYFSRLRELYYSLPVIDIMKIVE